MDNNKNKDKLSYLAVAGGTLLFYACVLPVCDSISTWIQQAVANKVTKLQYVMAQDQQEIEEISDKINGSGPVQAIGFHVDYDNNEDDDYYGKKNRKN